MRIVFVILMYFIVFPSIISSQTYLDSTATVQERVDDLLSRMTVDEKIGQMIQADHKAIADMQDMLTYHIGSVLSGGGSDPDAGNSPEAWADLYDSFQQKALESRLMIPMIYGIDAVHGHSNVTSAVIFPHNIGLGATRDSALVEETARITAVEMAATGMDWTFAPCVTVPQNERWGRTYEGFGETPGVVAPLGAAAVRGFQGDSLNMLTSVVGCAKHFLGDGGTTDGIDRGNTELSEEELRAVHLPGYIAAIENDVKTVMVSYSSWNGQKMHGHEYMINEVLKTELGFKGFVVSDWAGIDELPGDYSSDVKTAVNAGVDMVMVPNNYVDFFNILKSHVQTGAVTEARIDDAVSRILAVKFESGLFEHPYAQRSLLSIVGSESHREVGREAVRKSLTLLKKNDNVLPLPKTDVKIVVAGEHGDDIGLQCGGWTIQWQGASGDITDGTTILEAIQQAAPGAEIMFSADGSYSGDAPDYAVVVIGEEPYAEGTGDRTDLNLDYSDIMIAKKLKESGIPVITILISGRPMIINAALHFSDAFFAAWLPGTEGTGIADVLFGNYNPHGLLPMSWPKNMEQIPVNYGDDNYDPLFPLDYGITTFANSTPGSAPQFESGMAKEGGEIIELTFNKSMNNSGNSSAEFAILKNGTSVIGVTDFYISEYDDNRIIIELDGTISAEDKVTLSYISGNIKSEDGGTLAAFDNEEMINFLVYSPQVFSLPEKVEAENYSDMFGVQTENTSDIGGGLNVGWIDDGDWMDYNCTLDFSGTFYINFRVASESSGGKINFLVDGNKLFDQTVPVTGGWQSWTTVAGLADLTRGEFTIRIYAENGGFNLNWFDIVTFTDVEDNSGDLFQFRLQQNFPNPFNPTTTIKYSIAEPAPVKLKIYNALGMEVATLVDEYKSSGDYSLDFNGAALASGIYFYRLSAADYENVHKMMILK